MDAPASLIKHAGHPTPHTPRAYPSHAHPAPTPVPRTRDHHGPRILFIHEQARSAAISQVDHGLARTGIGKHQLSVLFKASQIGLTCASISFDNWYRLGSFGPVEMLIARGIVGRWVVGGYGAPSGACSTVCWGKAASAPTTRVAARTAQRIDIPRGLGACKFPLISLNRSRPSRYPSKVQGYVVLRGSGAIIPVASGPRSLSLGVFLFESVDAWRLLSF